MTSNVSCRNSLTERFMDSDLKKKLILIGAVFMAVVSFYYIASPYQNCKRNTGGDVDGHCFTASVSW